MGFGVFPPGRLHVKKHLAGKAARRSGVSHPRRVHGRKRSRFPAGWPRGRGRRSGLGCAPAHPHVWSPTAATATGTGRGSPPSEPRRPRGGSRRSPGSICRSAVSTALESACPVQKAPPSFPPAFLSSQGDTANPFCHPCDFPSLAAGTRGSDGRGIAAGTATRGKYSRSQLCGPAPDQEHTQPGMWNCSGNLSARYLECSRRTCAAVWEPLPPESAGAEREEG